MKTASKNILVATLSAITIINFAVPVLAGSSYGAYGGYGGSPPSDCLSIDQTVSNPAITKTIEYIDNITPQSAKYKPNQALYARIKVKNNGNEIVPNVIITNEIPKCFTYIGGPGSLNKGGNVLSISIGDMNPQEEKVNYVTYKVGEPTCFPNQPIYCAINKMSVQGDICNAVEDNAQLCVEPQVLGLTKGGLPIDVKETPDSGPEFGILLVGAQLALAGTGIYLKKRSNA
jgi:hypothetical protein